MDLKEEVQLSGPGRWEIGSCTCMESRVDCGRKEKHRGEIRSRDCVSSPREGEGETGAKWTPSGQLPGLTEQFLNRRLFQGEGILGAREGGVGEVMRFLLPDPAWLCPSLRNRPMVEGILQALEYLRGLSAILHPTQSTLALSALPCLPPSWYCCWPPPGTYLQQLHGPFMFPLSFCLGL